MSFRIDLNKTTDLLSRFHRQFMEPEGAGCLGNLRTEHLPAELVREAGEQWAGREVASYYSLAQASDLTQRLITQGAPVEVLSGALQSLEDSYRTMVQCAQISRSLGQERTRQVFPAQLPLFQNLSDPLVALYQLALVHFGFSFTLSIPMFDALGTIVTQDKISDICLTIAANLEEDADYGWALLQWLYDRMTVAQQAQVQQELPKIMAVFERRCFGNAEMLEALAGSEIIVEQQEPNLGTLTPTQYAAIFYHTMTELIFPKLQMMEIDAPALWREHYHLEAIESAEGMGIVAIDIVS